MYLLNTQWRFYQPNLNFFQSMFSPSDRYEYFQDCTEIKYNFMFILFRTYSFDTMPPNFLSDCGEAKKKKQFHSDLLRTGNMKKIFNST